MPPSLYSASHFLEHSHLMAVAHQQHQQHQQQHPLLPSPFLVTNEPEFSMARHHTGEALQQSGYAAAASSSAHLGVTATEQFLGGFFAQPLHPSPPRARSRQSSVAASPNRGIFLHSPLHGAAQFIPSFNPTHSTPDPFAAN
jgi:hypothetical protein